MRKLAVILWSALFISMAGFVGWIAFFVVMGIGCFIWLLRILVSESSYERVWQNWSVLSDEMKKRYNSRATNGEGFALYAEEHYTWFEKLLR